MRWTWDPNKDAINRGKHGLPLSIGEVALADPLAYSRHDPHPDSDRWDTLCRVGAVRHRPGLPDAVTAAGALSRTSAQTLPGMPKVVTIRRDTFDRSGKSDDPVILLVPV